jgi:DNA-binding NarL/FixJ family response regulator
MNIVLVDDHKIMRQGLRALLEKESDLIVIAEAGDGRQAIQFARELKPDLFIMDIALPILNGIEATRRIKSEFPEIEVLALSMHADKRYVTELLNAGADGYMLKDCAADELVTAIRTIMTGETYLSPPIASMIVNGFVRKKGSQHDEKNSGQAFTHLSSREREVLQMIAEGKSTKEMAFELSISTKTVESHRKQIMARLNIFNTAELTKFAVREGLTSL